MVIFLILMSKLPLLITVVTNTFKSVIMDTFGLPRWLSGKEPTCQSMQEMWVHSLGQEDPLEKEMATNFSILAWRIPWTEEPGRVHEVMKELNKT